MFSKNFLLRVMKSQDCVVKSEPFSQILELQKMVQSSLNG